MAAVAPSQAPYMSQALMERPRNSLSEKAEHFLQHELHHEVSVSQLAEHCGTSEPACSGTFAPIMA